MYPKNPKFGTESLEREKLKWRPRVLREKTEIESREITRDASEKPGWRPRA